MALAAVMKRQDSLTLFGGLAAWPLAARAAPMRRIGMLIGASDSDPLYRAYAATFKEELLKRGWVEGRNLRIDVRFGEGDAKRTLTLAAELVSLSPHAILALSALSTRALQQQTQTVPIVFAGASPLSDDAIVTNIARPRANITGFTNIYVSMGEKLLELLKEAAPRLVRIGYAFKLVRRATPCRRYSPPSRQPLNAWASRQSGRHFETAPTLSASSPPSQPSRMAA